MSDPSEIVLLSPNKAHDIRFIFAGGIRFGPDYYKLEINGKIIPERLFGFEYLWHPQSRFLALQEWLTTEFKQGPNTSLVLIDLVENRLSCLSAVTGGFMKPLKFEGDSIIYKKEYFASSKIIEYEVDMRKIANWSKII